jgi:putative sterol carrier protein
MADINSLEALLIERTTGKKPIGKVIAFEVYDEGVIILDARVEPVSVSRKDSDEGADATIAMKADDLDGLLNERVSGQSLLMTGRAKFKGNPTTVMKMRDLLVA